MFVFLLSMAHRGEIIEQAIRNSGLPISHIAKKLKRSRQWMYVMFENPNVPIEMVEEIGKIIKYDFSHELKNSLHTFSEKKGVYEIHQNDATYWREKYFALLEEYHELMKKV